MEPFTIALIAAAAIQVGAQFTDAKIEQRRQAGEARSRLKKGEYGFSRAQKQQQTTEANQQVAGQMAGQQAEIARQQAAGVTSGGGAAAAQRALAQVQAAQTAQNQAFVQAQSNQAARQQYQSDLSRIDAQAASDQQTANSMSGLAMQAGSGLQDIKMQREANLAGMDAAGRASYLADLETMRKARAVMGSGNPQPLPQ